MRARDFSLQDQYGKKHTLSEYKGKWLLIYFYPKDNTPGCTREACTFRDGIHEFTKRDIVIVGISKDSIESHKRFSNKFKLPFTILSDPEHKAMEAYGAWGLKEFMGKKFTGTWRNSYLINPKGDIVRTYEKVSPLVHASEILKDFDLLYSS